MCSSLWDSLMLITFLYLFLNHMLLVGNLISAVIMYVILLTREDIFFQMSFWAGWPLLKGLIFSSWKMGIKIVLLYYDSLYITFPKPHTQQSESALNFSWESLDCARKCVWPDISNDWHVSAEKTCDELRVWSGAESKGMGCADWPGY